MPTRRRHDGRDRARHGARRHDRAGVGSPAHRQRRLAGSRQHRRRRAGRHGTGADLWFQDTDEHETPRQRFHLDVWVAPEVAEQRIAAAVAAGGVIVDDSQAPSFTVIADPDGNKACVCTYLPPSNGD